MSSKSDYICRSCLVSLRRFRCSHLRTTASNLQRHLSSTRSIRKQPTSTSSTPTILNPPSKSSSDFKPLFASYILYGSPTQPQISYAQTFFTNPPHPTFLLSTPNFRSLPPSNIPEVAFLGRSNVGKSSLLNALLHRTTKTLAFTSSKPGRTRALTAFGVAGRDGEVKRIDKGESGKIKYAAEDQEGGGRKFERWVGRNAAVIVDMPGYGKGSREEWGREIMKYIGARAQLRRTFVLIDAEHGPKTTDMDLLAMLRADGIVHQIVLTKIDRVLYPNKTNAAAAERNYQKLEEMASKVRQLAVPSEERGSKALPDVLMCSTEAAWPHGGHNKMGINGLRWAVLQAAGLDCDERGKRRALDFEVAEKRPVIELFTNAAPADDTLEPNIEREMHQSHEDVWAGGDAEPTEPRWGRRRRTMRR